MMEMKFYICKHCGNIVAVVKASGAPISCCGEKMTYEAPKRVGLWRVNIEAKCEKDGDFMIVLRMSETPEKTFSVNQQIFILDENMRLYFEGKQTKRHRRRPSGRGKVHNKHGNDDGGKGEENV